MVGVDLCVTFVLKAVLVVMYDDNSKGECWACNGTNGVRMTGVL